MTTEVTAQAGKTKKLVLQMIGGGIAGGASVIALNHFLSFETLGADNMILAVVGLIYVLTGMIVLIGSAVPKMGAQMLNVSDEEDLLEQRHILLSSSLMILAFGAAQIILVLSGDGKMFPAWAGAGAMLLSMLFGSVIWIRDRHRYDEMMMKLSLDASFICFCGLWLVLVPWGCLAMTGLAPSPTGAAIVALFSGGYLLASVVAAGRVGLLAPK